MLTVIPKEKIRRIEIRVNSDRKTMFALKQELGCQYILNGGLYNMKNFTPACYLTVEGKVLSALADPFGLSAKGGSMVFSYANDVQYPYFVSCAFRVLVRDGKRMVSERESEKYGYSQRSAAGVRADGSVVLLCDQTRRSLGGIAGTLLEAGCEAAINLDGGGSSQCDFNGKSLPSTRIVHHYLCFWTL